MQNMDIFIHRINDASFVLLLDLPTDILGLILSNIVFNQRVKA